MEKVTQYDINNTSVTQVRFSQETPDVQTRSQRTSNRKTPFRERRFTPYHKTPKSRRIKGPTSHVRTPERVPGNKYKDFVNITWHVYRVSPLYRFSHDKVKHYSKLLSSYLEAESNHGRGTIVSDETADKATFTVIKDLKGLGDAGPDAVQITLKKKMTSGKQKGEAKVVLTAVLCCVQHNNDAVNRTHKAFSLLPLMLVRGPVTLARQLHSWLEMMFDCHISPVRFTPIQLSWMIAMWAGELLEKKIKPVHFEYKTPSEVEGLNRITINISAKHCKTLWDSIHDCETDEISEEEVNCFIKAQEAHFYHHFKIALFAMPLTRIGTALIYASTEGRLKIFSEKHVGQVLEHLTNLILEQRLL